MNYIQVPHDTKVAVIGDIHEHDKQYFEMIDKLQPSDKMIIVSVGDIYDKGFGVNAANRVVDHIRLLNKNKIGYVVRGNHELKRIRSNRNYLSEQLAWLKRQPLSVSFRFSSGSSLTVVHAGITPHHKPNDLQKNVEVCYVRKVDSDGKMIRLQWKEDSDGNRFLEQEKPGGVSWHEVYDGRFGYVAAGHAPQKDGVIKYYSHSCNVDTACYETGILSCQIFSTKGLEDSIQIEGKAANIGDGFKV